jgi:hypothetical protein
MIRGGHIIAVLIAALALKVALARKHKQRPDEQSNSLRGCFPSRAAGAACPLGGVGTLSEDARRAIKAHWSRVGTLPTVRGADRTCIPIRNNSGRIVRFEDIEDDGFITLDRNAFGFPANHGRH